MPFWKYFYNMTFSNKDNLTTETQRCIVFLSELRRQKHKVTSLFYSYPKLRPIDNQKASLLQRCVPVGLRLLIIKSIKN